MTNTYGGESWNKKLARAEVFRRALPRLHGRSGYAMVLAGPDAADVRLLRAVGIPSERIVAVDIDAECIKAAASVGATVFHGDIVEAARAYRGQVSLFVADFCSQMNEVTIELLAKAACIACELGASVVGAFSYGREIGRRAEVVKAAASVKFSSNRERFGLPSARKTRDSVPCQARLDVFNDHAKVAFAKRNRTLVLPKNPAIFYFASRDAGGGTPMMYVHGSITELVRSTHGPEYDRRNRHRMGCQYEWALVDGKFDYEQWSKGVVYVTKLTGGEKRVRAAAVALAREESSAAAADIYCLSTGRVAAWLAVDTMRRQREEASEAAE